MFCVSVYQLFFFCFLLEQNRTEYFLKGKENVCFTIMWVRTHRRAQTKLSLCGLDAAMKAGNGGYDGDGEVTRKRFQ